LGTNTGTIKIITTESKVDERVIGPVENVASRAFEVSEALARVPFLAPFATASSMAFGALKGISAIFGWSKPTIIEKPLYVRPEPFMNGANAIGFDTTHKVTLDPKQELTVDSSIVGQNEDAMTIGHIASRMSYYTTFTWTHNADPVSVPLFVTGVSPCLTTYYSNGAIVWSQPTAAAFASYPFTFWRGDIVFRIEVVCSQFHRGKLAVGFEPNCAQNVVINSTLSLNKQYLKVVDIQETQVFDVRVPWASYRPWLKTWNASIAYFSQDSTQLQNYGPGYANGYIFIFPFTALQSPDDSDVQVNIYMMSPNLQLNGVSTLGLPTGRAIYTESAVSERPAVTSCDQAVAVSQMDLNMSAATTSGICEDYFGEQPLSFRTILKRFIGSTAVENFAVAAGNTTFYVHQILPPNLLVYGGSIGSVPLDMFSYLRYAYLGIKGGIRVRTRIISPATTPSAYPVWMKYSLRFPSTSFLNTIAFASRFVTMARMQGSATFVPMTNAGVEAELPYYSNNLFQLCFSDTYDDGNDWPDNMEQLWYRNAELAFDSPTADTCALVVERAAAEDFSLLRFQGAPYHSNPPVA